MWIVRDQRDWQRCYEQKRNLSKEKRRRWGLKYLDGVWTCVAEAGKPDFKQMSSLRGAPKRERLRAKSQKVGPWTLVLRFQRPLGLGEVRAHLMITRGRELHRVILSVVPGLGQKVQAGLLSDQVTFRSSSRQIQLGAFGSSNTLTYSYFSAGPRPKTHLH